MVDRNTVFVSEPHSTIYVEVEHVDLHANPSHFCNIREANGEILLWKTSTSKVVSSLIICIERLKCINRCLVSFFNYKHRSHIPIEFWISPEHVRGRILYFIRKIQKFKLERIWLLNGDSCVLSNATFVCVCSQA